MNQKSSKVFRKIVSELIPVTCQDHGYFRKNKEIIERGIAEVESMITEHEVSDPGTIAAVAFSYGCSIGKTIR